MLNGSEQKKKTYTCNDEQSENEHQKKSQETKT